MKKRKIRTLIVDDEKHCRETLEQQLKWSCPQIEVVYKASGVDNALEAVPKFKPELVFLDIEMPEKTGFDFLKSIDDAQFEVIFTTAYDEFALEAFRVHAIDYLLKPVEEEQLVKAVDKAEIIIRQEDVLENLGNIIGQLADKQSDKTVVLPTSESAEFVQVDEIIRCQADGSYTKIFLNDGRLLLLAKSLQTIESLIDQPHFIRTHQSHVVNTRYIRRFLHADGGSIVLKDGSEIPVARSKRKAWKQWIDSL